jgi:membrane protein
MVRFAVELARSWATRFFDVQGVDRAMALAAQAFSALIPLLIVSSAVMSRQDGKSFADDLIDRFDLSGSAADSVKVAFTSSGTVEDSISVLGLLLLTFAGLSFTRGLQRLYEGAYGLPSLGYRNTPWGLAWLALIALYFTLRPVLAGVFSEDALRASVSLALAAGEWTITPHLLLGRRLEWRRLVAGGVLTAVGMTLLAASSIIWLPETISSSSEQFGAIGVAFALLSWVVAAAFVLVAAATGGAVISERTQP